MSIPTRLFDFAYFQMEHHPLEEMMTSREGDRWTGYSTSEYLELANLVSRGLIAIDVLPGDRIALITHSNRCEWNIMDHGILQVGAIDVPIYPTMTPQDYEYIMNHAGVKYCFVSNDDLYKKVKSIRDTVPGLREVYTFEKVAGAPNWKDLFKEAETVTPQQVLDISSKVNDEELATIIYTSGTTGLPKGVMLSHRNIVSNVLDSEPRLPVMEYGKSRALSFLPCCHIFERMLQYLYIHNSVKIYLTGMEAIKDDLLVAKPHIFTGVPRLFEKFYDGIVAKGTSSGGLKARIFRWAHDLAVQWAPDRENGWWYEFKLGIARKLVFSKVKAALGLTQIQAVPSGSAALQPRLARFFCGAGFSIKEGYGLTETSPVVAVNTLRKPHMWKSGTVGKPIRNVEVKIEQDGEILVKGPNVMMGYYKDQEKTDEVLKDGWFHTGDIGEMRNGFLAITDRKKELFKTSGGKYVAPQVLENALKESNFIEQVIVLGDNEKFPAALISPEMTFLGQWAKAQGINSTDNNALLKNDKVQDLFESEIEKINKRFGNWEQVKAFRLLPRPFTIDDGEITPTLKLKRKKIMENWKSLVNDLYNR